MVSAVMSPVIVLFVLLLLLALPGCGEKSVTGTAVNKIEESQKCIDCHGASVSPVTGNLITDEWKLSVHNIENKAGCIDCHFESPSDSLTHPESCSKCHGGSLLTGPSGLPPHVIVNPDMYGACAKCHAKGGGFRVSTYDGVTINTVQAHFNNITSGVIPRAYPGLYFSNYSTYVVSSSTNATANWASSGYLPIRGDASKYGCRACHNPHDTTSQISIFRQWARSGHGNPETAARTNLDFKSRGTNDPAQTTVGAICVRCHTSTGLINYVSSDFSNVAALAPANSQDHSKEVTGCNVCHDDGRGNAYGYRLRNALQANMGRTGVPAYYNYSAATGGNSSAIPSTTVRNIQIIYPNASNSNICIVCHMGREIGLVIKKAAINGLDFTKTARINSHVFAAGSNLFQESGFEFYTSVAKYPVTSFLHNIAGMNNFQGTGTRGPCIACHMNSSISHSFMPVTKDQSGAVTSITSHTCARCHPSPATNNQNMDQDILETNRLGFKAAMRVLRDLIVSKFNVAPSLFTLNGNGSIAYPSGAAANKIDWSKACNGTATAASSPDGVKFIVPGSGNMSGGPDSIRAPAYNMGAVFNYELLYADYGAYVHNPNYIKRLVFDSIDWLQDCSLTKTNGSDVCSAITDNDARTYLCGTTNTRP